MPNCAQSRRVQSRIAAVDDAAVLRARASHAVLSGTVSSRACPGLRGGTRLPCESRRLCSAIAFAAPALPAALAVTGSTEVDSSHNEQLVVALRAASQALAQRRSIRDLEQTLAQIVTSAVRTIPGVEAGSISITEHGRIQTRHPSTENIRRLDETQSALHEGPCITAIEDPPETGLVIADDFAGADAARWPRFAPHVLRAGYRAMMSTQLSTDGGMRAALNLYSAAADAFDEQDRHLAGLFGIQAATLLHGADQAGHLQRAVDSRDLIGQAKGILMERFTVDDDAAFQMLVRASQDSNMKLTAVAQWLIATAGKAPGLDPHLHRPQALRSDHRPLDVRRGHP
jgi:hypothetical protein